METTPHGQHNQVEATFEGLKPFNKEAHFVKATGTAQGRTNQVGKGRQDEIGSYGSNNGTLAFVDENGDFWVGRANDREAYKALEEAGYQNRGVYVPHSNDGGVWMRKNFDEPRGFTREAIEAKRIKAQVEKALELIKPFNKEAHFVKATGTTGHIGGLTGEVGKGYDREIGSYGSNNGTLAFVDENGDYWVGRANDREGIKALQEASYQSRGVYVPHSNDGGVWMRKNFDSRQN